MAFGMRGGAHPIGRSYEAQGDRYGKGDEADRPIGLPAGEECEISGQGLSPRMLSQIFPLTPDQGPPLRGTGPCRALSRWSLIWISLASRAERPFLIRAVAEQKQRLQLCDSIDVAGQKGPQIYSNVRVGHSAPLDFSAGIDEPESLRGQSSFDAAGYWSAVKTIMANLDQQLWLERWDQSICYRLQVFKSMALSRDATRRHRAKPEEIVDAESCSGGAK